MIKSKDIAIIFVRLRNEKSPIAFPNLPYRHIQVRNPIFITTIILDFLVHQNPILVLFLNLIFFVLNISKINPFPQHWLGVQAIGRKTIDLPHHLKGLTLISIIHNVYFIIKSFFRIINKNSIKKIQFSFLEIEKNIRPNLQLWTIFYFFVFRFKVEIILVLKTQFVCYIEQTFYLILKQNFSYISQMQKNKQNLQSQSKGDRFIPSEIRSCAFQVEYNRCNRQTTGSNYEELLGKGILDQINLKSNHKIMSFTEKGNTLSSKREINNDLAKSFAKIQSYSQKKTRKISKKPYKILDAPNLQDDFYLNLLDWSQKNQIAVALDTSLYLWSGCSSQITRLYQTSLINDYICSVSFCDDNKIAIGNSNGHIKVFDIAKRKKVNDFQGHYGRVGSLDWSHGLLASGSRDGAVASWDLRSGLINKYKAHTQEICGLKWSPQGNYIASGGNDNKLVVYSNKGNAELVKFHDHKAAVKAIGWCPSNPSTLASGGGTADRHIRFFSTQTLLQNFSIDTGSQICNLVFSKISNEMITTHGYSLNQINLWNTNSNWQQKSVNKVATLTGHTYRVLYLAMSPSGQSILTGAGDETLRFWNVFDSSQYKKHETLSFQMDLR